MRSFLTDARHATRRLAKSPAFTLTAVVTLALAIGANTAIYSVVDALLIRALPYRDPAHLTELGGLTKDGVVRANVPPASLIGLLKQRVWEVDPVQPIQKIQTIDAAYAEFLATPRFYAWLMGRSLRSQPRGFPRTVPREPTRP